jgi:hypothetical protein
VADPEIELFFVDEMRKVPIFSCHYSVKHIHRTERIHQEFANSFFVLFLPSLSSFRVGYGLCLGQRTGSICKDHYADNIIQVRKVRGFDWTITYLCESHYIRGVMECKQLSFRSFSSKALVTFQRSKELTSP